MKKFHFALFCCALTLAATAWGEEKFSSTAQVVGKAFPKLTVNFFGEKPAYEGKPLLVEFWATWCPPCRKSIPHLNEVHQKFKDQGLVVIGISDEKKATIESFQKSVPMDYSVAIDASGKLGEQLAVRGIPHAFLVGKDGKVLWEGHPMELEEGVIQKALQ